MQTLLSISFYIVLAVVSLGAALLFVSFKRFLPFKKRLSKVDDKFLIGPFFLIFYGIALLTPIMYPYAHFITGSTPTVTKNELENSVAVGLNNSGSEEQVGMDGALLVIPSVKLKTSVKDTLDKVQLQQTAGHVPWTAVPGEDGRIVILGENYMHQMKGGPNVLFTTLHLIKPEDEIQIAFGKQIYEYEVRKTKIITPSELEKLAIKGEKEELVLVTCYPPGTQVNRFVVFADPIPKS